MFNRFLSLIIVLFFSSQLLSQEKNVNNNTGTADGLSTTNKKIDFTIRLGQGGFTDDRSPLGNLGGGQLALDIKPRNIPIAISVSGEYYTNSADPTHSYEIDELMAVNILYMTKVFNIERINLFAGGGIGRFEVPKDEDESEARNKGIVYNIEGGINIRAFWKMGFYGIYKYLYAKKEINNVKVIDFSEHIVLLGVTFNFSL